MIKAIMAPSDRSYKKWMIAYFNDEGKRAGPVIHFGDSGYQDYTQHKDASRKDRYHIRHAKDSTRFNTPGELSRVILWSAPSIEQGIKNYEEKYNIQIILRKTVPFIPLSLKP